MRFFNTTGPVQSEKHYSIPPLSRLDIEDVLTLIRDERYFVLRAPRQTGKTSALLALRDLLNSGAEGDYRCVYANVEAAQAAREDTEKAMRAILGELASWARSTLGDETLADVWPGILAEAGPAGALREVLSRWSEADPRPLVLLIDEIDALVGDSLLSVLRQLRAGYVRRPKSFPQSVVLCGVRDVRDYRIHSSAEKEIIAGGSAFNIKAESLRMGDFSETQVRGLLAQHTAETAQVFTEDALAEVWTLTRGQPWLVNALAYDVCFRNKAGRDRGRAIDAGEVTEARERLIARRETHLDQLADKLQEERVRRVVGPLLSGGDEREFSARDIEYVRDLGLIASDGLLRIANPIYAEVVPRELTYAAQAGLVEETAWYLDADGGLEVGKLLTAFQEFFREHSEHWVARFDYREAEPQLLLQAFLQRVVNGGGRIEREYGLGRMRTDLLIVWPQGARTRKFVIECKVLHKSLERTIGDGLEQTAAYMDRCAAESGHLIIFDRDESRSWEDKLFHRRELAGGVEIEVWGM
ncbi:MAG: AAA-like domain-containing protein [Deltaproteobacteria bacterium]|nr:AAA-like domain-containing protein [Deltaproteobacteria bacterium]